MIYVPLLLGFVAAFVLFFAWNPKISRDGRFMKFCTWVSRHFVKISGILMFLMVQTVFFLVWQVNKEIKERDQQIEQLKKKCPDQKNARQAPLPDGLWKGTNLTSR